MSVSTQEIAREDRIKISDMQKEMIPEAFKVAAEAVAKHEIEQQIAKYIKQHFDRKYQ